MKMEKIFLFILLSAFCLIGFAQNTIVINQQSSYSEVGREQSNPNIFYINGISSALDIGGVEVSRKRNPDPYGNPYIYKVYFKNYRDYSVEVLYEFYAGPPGNKSLKTGNIIVPAESTKSDGSWYKLPENFRTIVRKL